MRKFQRHSCFQCRPHFTTSFDPHSGHFSFRDFTIKNNFDETVSSKLLYRYVNQLVIDISPTTFCTYTLGLRLLLNKKAGQNTDPLKSGKRDSSPHSRADAPSFRSPLSRHRRQLPRGAGREFFVSFTTKKRVSISDPLKSGKRDSNSRPRPWQGRALPTELFPHFYSERTVILSNGLQK